MNDDTCNAPDCEKKRRGTYCSMHAERLRVHGSLDKPQRKVKVKPPCAEDGCDEPTSAKGLCSKHYKRAWHEAHWTETYAKQVERRNQDREAYLKDSREYYRKNRARILAAQARQYRRNSDAIKAYSKRYRSANRDKLRRAKQAYYLANRERIRLERKTKYTQNRTEVLERNRAWRAKNIGYVRAQKREWARRNRLRRNELEMRRRARMCATQVEPVRYDKILDEHGMFCHICGMVIVDRSDLHFDHVIPLARGGTHTYDNIRPAHALCNMRKHASMPT